MNYFSLRQIFRNISRRWCARGSTYVELLVYFLLAAFVLMLLPPLVSRALSSRVRAEHSQTLDRAGFYVLQQISQKVRYSDEVSADSVSDVLTIVKGARREEIYTMDGQLYMYIHDLTYDQILPMLPNDIAISSFSVSDVSLTRAYPSVRIVFSLAQGDMSRSFVTAASRRLQEKL